MTMPKDWKPGNNDSNEDNNYLYKSRNSMDDYSIDNEINIKAKPYRYKNSKPLSFNAKFAIGYSIFMFIIFLSLGSMNNLFSEGYFWMMFFLFVFLAPILGYGKMVSTTNKPRKRRYKKSKY